MKESASPMPPAQPSPGAPTADDASRYRKILDSLSDMVFCKSASYQVTFANRATQAYYDATEEQLHGVTDVPYNQLDFTEQYLRDDRIIFETGQRVVREEEPNVAPDGTIHYFHTVKSPIVDDAGRVVELVGVSRDVTEQRASRIEAERSRTHLELALEAAQMGTWEWDIEHDRVHWSPQEERLYGLSEGTFPGTRADYISRIHPEDRESSWAEVEKALRNKSETHHVLHRIVTPLGEVRWLDSHGRFIYSPEGRPLRLVGISVDVTPRMVERDELRRQAASMAMSRDELLRLFDQTPALISVTNPQTQIITYQNAHARALVGGRDLKGKRAADVFPDEQVKPFLEIQARVSQTGQPYIGNEVHLRLDLNNDGVPEDRYFNFIYQPLRDPFGVVDSVMSFAVEATDQVQARQLVEAKAEELHAARAEAEAANKAKGDFLARMSHDLRTPLNAIGGFTELVLLGVHGPVTDPQREALQRVQRAQRHLLTLINDILSFARLEAGQVSLVMEAVPVAQALQQVGTLVEQQAQAKGLALHSVGGPEGAMVRADPQRLQQVLLNLVVNAVKFTDHGSVTLGWNTSPQTVRIFVRDTGPGIAPETLANIFEPFVQGSSETLARAEGVGLGLTIGREFSRMMGGTLSVESALGEGSTFIVELERA